MATREITECPASKHNNVKRVSVEFWSPSMEGLAGPVASVAHVSFASTEPNTVGVAFSRPGILFTWSFFFQKFCQYRLLVFLL